MLRRRNTLLVFADQAMVSGCNFLVSALMARYLGVADFGQWILVFGVVIFANTVAGGLVWIPMLTLTPKWENEVDRQRFLAGSFAFQWVLAFAIALCVGLGGVLVSWARPQWLSASIALAVAGVALVFQLQEWLRRYCFAIEKPGPVFVMDVLGYGGQVVLVVLLHLAGHLSLGNALMAVMLAYGSSFIVGVATLKVQPDWGQLSLSSREMLMAGKAYLVGEQLQWLGTAGLLYVSAHLLGPHAAGAVRAVQNLLGPTNMIFQSFNNLVSVRSAVIFNSEGRAALNSYILKVFWQFGLPLFAGLAVISSFGSEVMTLAFGPSFGHFGYLVPMQSLLVGLTLIWVLAMYRVRVLGRSDIIMKAGAVQAFVSLAFALASASWLQEAGIVLASCIGMVAALLVLFKC